jgi:hypothetical protein
MMADAPAASVRSIAPSAGAVQLALTVRVSRRIATLGTTRVQQRSVGSADHITM